MNINQINNIKIEYVISFSDALFAFAITLIVALTFDIPNFPSNISESEITNRLGELIVPNIIHYIISFFVVGMYWVAYHRAFEYIKRVDITLIWLNLIFLFFISLVAYFTGLLTTYDTYRIIVIYFASVLSAAGFTLCIIWWYATHNRKLVDKDMDSQLVRYLSIAVQRGLVEYSEVRDLYRITNAGLVFLDKYAHLLSLLPKIPEQSDLIIEYKK